ncbi:hypothetical protein [Dankookia sp. P2]|uniref:hypothetical protein n=1 Tax=Dankookia sp. P2 TaxID=3423955 RepID=UPI003D66CBB6
MHGVGHSGSGTGKGLLVRSACAIATSAKPRAITAGNTEAELEKRIVAALVAADPVVFLDNVNNRELKSDALASAMTESPAQVRVLGLTENASLNSTAFVAITGNGLKLSEDLVRRFIPTNLDARMENPESRSFKGDFLAETLAARDRLLACLIAIWRWGRQLGAELPAGQPLGSYPQWGRWCRDPLLALGCVDPVLLIARAKTTDPNRQRLGELFEEWFSKHGSAPVKASELASSVLWLIDRENQERQNIRAILGRMEGTRARGYVLNRIPGTGAWTTDLFLLLRADDAESHGSHGGHRGAPPTSGYDSDPYDPMNPMPSPPPTRIPSRIPLVSGRTRCDRRKSLG